MYSLTDDNLTKPFSFVQSANKETIAACRSSDMPYQKGVNYTVILDGFIVSDNVEAVAENMDTDFTYSDHNPVKMTFTLK